MEKNMNMKLTPEAILKVPCKGLEQDYRILGITAAITKMELKRKFKMTWKLNIIRGFGLPLIWPFHTNVGA